MTDLPVESSHAAIDFERMTAKGNVADGPFAVGGAGERTLVV